MMLDICYYFLIFIIYSMVGWLLEVILSLIQKHKFVDRGFLLGPYCPIYGWGALLITSLLKNYLSNFIVIFILATVICMILEYITSFLMEKIYKTRWWDYSQMKYNINGRICLETAIPFGIGALIIMYIVHPCILFTLGMLSDSTIIIISCIVFVIFLVDNVISFNVISKFKNTQLKLKKDNTEEITAKVRNYLMEQSKLTKRLSNAFPNMILTFEDIKERSIKEFEEKTAKFLRK